MTISGYGEVMREQDPDWHLVAKKIMYNFRAFNAEICDVPSDAENVCNTPVEETEGSENEKVLQRSFSSAPDWEKAAALDFNFAEFNFNCSTQSSPRTGYGHDSDFEPESESPNILDMKDELLKPNKDG